MLRKEDGDKYIREALSTKERFLIVSIERERESVCERERERETGTDTDGHTYIHT